MRGTRSIGMTDDLKGCPMYPTLFRVPFLPDAWADVKSYGVMIMIGFLGGIWLATRRAQRVRADPEVVLNMGFIALLAGVAGARAMYVIHYWDSRFANQPSPLRAVFDIRAGGLEFWGGPLLVVPLLVLYLGWTKRSIRWYLDLTVPSLMFGLAMARIGCFLNGCCWGAVCLDPHDPARQKPALPWAVRFPYGSPAMVQQFEFGQLTVPKELLCFLPAGQVIPLPREEVEATRENLDGPARDLRLLTDQLAETERRGGDQREKDKLRARIRVAEQRLRLNEQRFSRLRHNCARYGLLPSDLQELATHHPSLPTHPAQLYAFITGVLLYVLLHGLFYRRRRHGIVLGWFFILYSIARLLEEAIRQDNPLDVGGLTISQAISILMFAVGVVWLWIMQGQPIESPLAQPLPVARKSEEAAAARA